MQDNNVTHQEREKTVGDSSGSQMDMADDGGNADESNGGAQAYENSENNIVASVKTDAEISEDQYAKADDSYENHVPRNGVKPPEPEFKIVYNVRRQGSGSGNSSYTHVANGHASGGKSGRSVVLTVFLAMAVLVFIAYATMYYMQNFGSGFVWPKGDDKRSDFGVILSPPVLVSEGNGILETLPRAPIGDGVKMKLSSQPEGVALSKQDIYKKCSQSVVAIMAKTEDESKYFWGSGIIISDDGYILTNYHVLEEGTVSVAVTLTNDKEYEARLVGIDEYTDIAVLKIDGNNLPVAEFGDSSLLEEGEDVLAIGNPLGKDLRGTITNGIISAINRDIDYGGYTMTLLQTTAAINEGNSGGPLINMHGQVIGITNMKMVSYTGAVEGIAFAIPSSSIKPVVDEIIELGYVSGRPAIGVWVQDIPEAVKKVRNLPDGVYVESVFDDTDAFHKGVKEGDVITAVDGESVKASVDLNVIKDALQVGDTLTITIYRDGETFDVEIELCDMADLKK